MFDCCPWMKFLAETATRGIPSFLGVVVLVGIGVAIYLTVA